MEYTKTYKVRGSHKDERRIRILLGHDPGIHSGNAGKGAFCLCVTTKEYKLLSDEGFKIGKKPIR